MMNFLLRRVFPEGLSPDDPKARTRAGSLSGAVGIGANLLLFAGKVALGAVTGSVSVTADALNNLSDASSAIVTLLGFRMAGKPADAHHPYGHARMEYLSGLAVAVMILFIGLELAKTSIIKILNPEPVAFSWIAAAVLALAMGVKLGLWLFNRELGRRIGSSALLATAADSRNDVLATGSVLAAMTAEHFLNWRFDGIMGLAVAVFILVSGWNLARETVSPLLGEAADPALRDKITDLIRSCPLVLGLHDLMVHDYGPGQRFASIHVEMDKNQDPLVCHQSIDDLERACLEHLGVHLVIHYDPVVVGDPELDRLRRLVTHILQMKDSRLTIHDFRVVPGADHTSLIFDLALPASLRGREQEIQTALETTLNDLGETTYRAAITFDPAQF